MVNTNNDSKSRKPLRLWPGVIVAITLVLTRFVVPVVAPDAMVFGMPAAMLAVLAGLVCALAIIVWWLFFSRAPWLERLGALVVMTVALAATWRVVHPSIAGGMMGLMLLFYAIPALSLALVAAAVASRRLSSGARRASLAGAIVLGCGVFTLLRTDGLMGAGSLFHWRWTPTAEDRLLAQANDEPKPLPPPSPAVSETPREAVGAVPPPVAATPIDKPVPPAAATATIEPRATKPPTPRDDESVSPVRVEAEPEWPGFRGPDRDSVVRGAHITTDWSASPPVEMWRRPIGPGWSSFAVHGDLLYTQEQRGDDEIVACYKVSTGEPVWRHRDPVRFWESNGGAGPRATPTLSHGRVYAFGATGILNALDARTGKLVWSRNVSKETDRRVPDWGFASSPLVIGDIVIVAASGSLAAYDTASGNPLWKGPRLYGSYSSPHRVTLDGVEQVVLLTGSGAAGFAPATGALLWEHKWEAGGATIVQPALTPDGDILIQGVVMSGGAGTRRLHVTQGPSAWTVEERWTSIGLKPYFNDFVIHHGHAYGFDGAILASINLEDGKRNWKGGRYGNGQLVLLADQDLLLVISEEGELALVSATIDQFREIARFPALNAKTWNHPVLIDDVLLVRNGEEMAAFRLSATDR